MEANEEKELEQAEPEEVEEDEDEKDEEEEAKSKNSGSEEEESSGESGLKKKITSQLRKESNRFKRIKEAAMDKIIFVVALCLIALFITPAIGAKVFEFLAGVETVVVHSKAIVDSCYQVTVVEGSSYCVDKDSFERATVGETYHLDEYDYYHILREVREWK